MKGFIRKSRLLEFIIILLLAFIPLLWFKNGQMALGHDMGFPLAPIDYFQDRTFTWSNMMGTFGSNRTESLGFLFIHGLEALVSYLGFSLVDVQRITFGFWLVLPAICMYVLLKKLFPKQDQYVVRLFGSLFYSLNHYLLQGWMIAERSKFSYVAVFPLAVLALVNVIVERRSILVNAFLLVLVLTVLAPGVALPLLGAFAMGVVVVGVVLSVFSGGDLFVKRLGRLGLFLVVFGLLYLLFNFYWIYPYFKSFTHNVTSRVAIAGGGGGAADWSKEISKYSDYYNLLRLQGIPDWYSNPDHPYANAFFTNPLLVVLGVFFSSVMFLSFLLGQKLKRKRDLYILLPLSVLLVFIPLAAGSHPPLGFLFDFALRHIPFFVMFRSPYYKFGMVLWFGFSILIAAGLWKIWNYLGRRFVRYLFLFFVFVGLIVYNYPFFNGIFFDWSRRYSTRVNVPDYVFDYKSYSESNRFFGRTLFLPSIDPRTREVVYDWKYFSLSTIPSLLIRKPVITNDIMLRGYETVIVDGIQRQLLEDGRSPLLRYLNTDGIVFQRDAFATKDSYFLPGMYEKMLSLNDLYKHKTDFGRWSLYEYVGERLPVIYSPESIRAMFVSSENLAMATAYKQFDGKSDSFYYQESQSGLPFGTDEYVSSYLIEAGCTNCERRIMYNVISEPPRIKPGSRFYPLFEYVRFLQKARLGTSQQRIDFILGDISKEYASLNLLALGNDYELVREVTDDILSELEDVEVELLRIDESVRSFYVDKVYQYVRYFAVNASGIPREGNDAKIYQAMDRLEDRARLLISNLSTQDFSFEDPNLRDSYNFVLDLLMEGEYRLKVASHISSVDEYRLLVDDREVLLSRQEEGEVWFESEPLLLTSGSHRLEVPNYAKSEGFNILTEHVEIESVPGVEKCIEYGVADDFDASLDYEYEFEFRSITGSSPFFEVLEKVEGSDDWLEAETYSNYYELDPRQGRYLVSGRYYPKDRAKDAIVSICLDPLSLVDSRSEVRNLKVRGLYPIPSVFVETGDDGGLIRDAKPEIRFVAINQANYLVRVDSSNPEYILNFNVRNDDGWVLREINAEGVDGYFTGASMNYPDAGVTEHEMKEGHFLSGLVFDYLGGEKNNKFMLNGFSNAWKIEDGLGVKYYLIEYTLQRDFYYSLVVSLGCFMVSSFVVGLYVVRNRKKARN